MAGVHDSYTKQMYQRFGHFASWMPNSRLTLGDVGTVRARRFEKLTTLAELGISFEEDEPSVVGEMEYSTAGSVAVASNADIAGAAAMTITFTGEGATLFQAGGCAWSSIANIPELGRKLGELVAWQSDYVVVTQVLTTGPAVVLVSSTKGATVEVHLDSGVLPGDLLTLAANGQMNIKNSTALAARVTVGQGATPLFSAMRLSRPLFKQSRLKWRHSKSSPQTESTRSSSLDGAVLTELSWDEFDGGHEH